MGMNVAFFALYENAFVVMKRELGEKKALELFEKILEKALKAAYDSIGSIRKGDPENFVETVAARDRSVGLRVQFPVISKDKIIYKFLDDPFPNLKGEVSAEKLWNLFMNFKVRYLLGDDWQFKMTKHFWNGDDCIEFVLTKKGSDED